jgi:hypothetical protein
MCHFLLHQAYKAYDIMTACRAAFDHLDVRVEDLIAEGDRVSAWFVATS